MKAKSWRMYVVTYKTHPMGTPRELLVKYYKSETTNVSARTTQEAERKAKSFARKASGNSTLCLHDVKISPA